MEGGSSYTIGDELEQGHSKAIKTIVAFGGQIVYITAIIYAEVHGYSLLKIGIDPQLLMWAIIGMFALGITALLLPFGLKHWFTDKIQRFVGFGFYGLDAGLLFFNAIADYARNTDGSMPGWLGTYMLYIVPATPIIVGLGWSILTLIDPEVKERIMVETLRTTTKAALATKIAQAAKSKNVDDRVAIAAEELVDRIVSQTLGLPSYPTRSLPSNTIDGAMQDPAPRKKRIWDAIRPAATNGNGNGNGNGHKDELDDADYVIEINNADGKVDVRKN